jgi:Protein of unknown function (DUF3606)
LNAVGFSNQRCHSHSATRLYVKEPPQRRPLPPDAAFKRIIGDDGFISGCPSTSPAICEQTACLTIHRKTDYRDRDRINVHQDHKLRYWSKELGVTPEIFKDTVQKVGVCGRPRDNNSADDKITPEPVTLARTTESGFISLPFSALYLYLRQSAAVPLNSLNLRSKKSISSG